MDPKTFLEIAKGKLSAKPSALYTEQTRTGFLFQPRKAPHSILGSEVTHVITNVVTTFGSAQVSLRQEVWQDTWDSLQASNCTCKFPQFSSCLTSLSLNSYGNKTRGNQWFGVKNEIYINSGFLISLYYTKYSDYILLFF